MAWYIAVPAHKADSAKDVMAGATQEEPVVRDGSDGNVLLVYTEVPDPEHFRIFAGSMAYTVHEGDV